MSKKLTRRTFFQFFLICSVVLTSALSATETPFPYDKWENIEGRVLEARFERLKDADTVTLQMKNGGMRHDIKRATLSDDTDKKIKTYIEESKKTLLEAKRIEGAEIYKAVALGLKAEAETALEGKSMSLDVHGFKISTDKLTAILELESGIYARIRLSGKYEFYEKNKGLYARSTIKGAGGYLKYWWSSDNGAIQDGRLVVQEGDVWKFKFTDEVRLDWERVGVTDGVIITD